MTTRTRKARRPNQAEQILRDYFDRGGWTVTKLDTGTERAADFRVDDGNRCFLCEIKTVTSARADLPWPAPQLYPDARKREQDRIREWAREHPDSRLILTADEYAFAYGDEAEFAKRYCTRTRHTGAAFSKFAQVMKQYLQQSCIRQLPYTLRLDSDDLYVPNEHERAAFFKWLEHEIRAIDEGNPGWQWHVQKLPDGRGVLYAAFYQIHKPAHHYDVESTYQLTITGPHEAGGLVVHVYSYGGLNLDTIARNVQDGVAQLNSSASRERDQRIPRIVVLTFESGIGFDWQDLDSHIAWLLMSHNELSAIAVLDWTAQGTPPPQEAGLPAWIEFHVTTPVVPYFVVYHNAWLQEVKPLPPYAFADELSVQCSPVRRPPTG